MRCIFRFFQNIMFMGVRMAHTRIINELNNKFVESVTLFTAPLFNVVPNLESCNLGNSKGKFNFSDYEALVKINSSDTATFFESQVNAENND